MYMTITMSDRVSEREGAAIPLIPTECEFH